ncbi:DUF1788 domain-containing protein, partial [bacterium]
RLNAALDRLVSDDFIQGRGLGNEIAFYIFDYPASEEPYVRDRFESMVAEVRKRKPELRVAHLNLLRIVVDLLGKRGLLDKTIELQRKRGDAETLRVLSAPLRADRIAAAIADAAPPEDHDLLLLTGVGSAYPLVRSHGLLNNLHTALGSTPLVMFYPGTYSGQHLSLFDMLNDDNYYRAFRLVP